MPRLHAMLAGATLVALLGCSGPPEGPLEGAGRGASPAPPERLKLLEPLDSPLASDRPALQEVEPNNRASEAQLLTTDRPLQGESAKRGDVDWYRLELPSEREVRVEVLPAADLDLALSVHVGKGEKTLRRIHNGGKGAPEVISNVVLEGSVLLQVKARSGKGTYRLTSRATPVSPSSEREPNGSTRNATPLTLASTLLGFANNDEDRDTFVITPPAGATEGPFSLEAIGVPDATLRMTLFRGKRSQGSTVLLGPEEPILLHGIGPGEHQGPIHVTLRCTSGFNVETPWSLRLMADPAPLDALPEPNNSRANAGELRIDEPRKGAIQWAGDIDSWTMNEVSDGVLRIEASGIPGMRLKLQVLGSEDAPLGESSSQRAGSPATLPNISGARGPLFIQVSALDQQFDPRQSFTLEATWRDSTGEEREPNDSVEQPDPSPLGVGVARRGFLASSTDRDIYRYRHAGKPALMILRLRAPPNLPARMRLLDQAGEESAATGFVAPGTARTLTQYFEPGDYYVEVQGGEGFHAEAPYTIALLP